MCHYSNTILACRKIWCHHSINIFHQSPLQIGPRQMYCVMMWQAIYGISLLYWWKHKILVSSFLQQLIPLKKNCHCSENVKARTVWMDTDHTNKSTKSCSYCKLCQCLQKEEKNMLWNINGKKLEKCELATQHSECNDDMAAQIKCDDMNIPQKQTKNVSQAKKREKSTYLSIQLQ